MHKRRDSDGHNKNDQVHHSISGTPKRQRVEDNPPLPPPPPPPPPPPQEETSDPANAVNATEPKTETAKFCFHTESWQGRKLHLEDRHINHETIPGVGTYFGLFDGHGGTKCAEFACKSLHKSIQDNIRRTQSRPSSASSSSNNNDGTAFLTRSELKQCLTEAFKSTDNEYLVQARIKGHDDGSTGLVLFFVENGILAHETEDDDAGDDDVADGKIHATDNKKKNTQKPAIGSDNSNSQMVLAVCNLGDSRAVMCRAGRPLRLSEDHKPNRWDEKRRIEKAGGQVVQVSGVWRVANAASVDLSANKQHAFLATSRTFGDRALKEPPILSSVPDIRLIDLTPEDLYVVIACDGVWDVLSDAQVVSLVNANIENVVEASSTINRTAFHKQSEDNLTNTVIRFEWNLPNAEKLIREAEKAPEQSNDDVDIFGED